MDEDYKTKYEKLKDFVRGKWKGDCAECAAIANEILNKETTNTQPTTRATIGGG